MALQCNGVWDNRELRLLVGFNLQSIVLFDLNVCADLLRHTIKQLDSDNSHLQAHKRWSEYMETQNVTGAFEVEIQAILPFTHTLQDCLRV